MHLIDTGIDTGPILGQAWIELQPGDSFVTYPYLQIKAGLPLIVDAMGGALSARIRKGVR